jgi:hypothetical protein
MDMDMGTDVVNTGNGEQGLPPEILNGLYREELARLGGENTDLRLENRWQAQIITALQAQLQAAASDGHTHEPVEDGSPPEE